MSLVENRSVIDIVEKLSEAIEKAEKQECFDYENDGQYKQVWWLERTVRDWLSPYFRFIDSTTEKCLRFSLWRLNLSAEFASLMDDTLPPEEIGLFTSKRVALEDRVKRLRDGHINIPNDLQHLTDRIQKIAIPLPRTVPVEEPRAEESHSNVHDLLLARNQVSSLQLTLAQLKSREQEKKRERSSFPIVPVDDKPPTKSSAPSEEIIGRERGLAETAAQLQEARRRILAYQSSLQANLTSLVSQNESDQKRAQSNNFTEAAKSQKDFECALGETEQGLIETLAAVKRKEQENKKALDQAQAEARTLREALDDLTNKKAGLSSELEQLQRDNLAANSDLTRLRTQLQNANAESELAKAQSAAANERAADAEAQKDQYLRTGQKEIARVNDKNRELREQLVNKTQELELLKQKTQSKAEEDNKLEDELARVKTELSELRATFSNLLIKQAEALQKERELKEQKQKLQEELQNVTADHNKAKIDLAQAKEDKQTAEDELHHANEKLDALNRVKQENDDLKRKMQHFGDLQVTLNKEELKSKGLADQLQIATETREAAEKSRDIAVQSFNDQSLRLQALELRNKALEQKLEQLQSQHDEKVALIQHLRAEIESLKQAVKKNETSATDLEAQQKQTQFDLANAMQKLQEKETECGKIREALESQKRQTEIYKGQVDLDQNVITSLQKRNSEFLEQIGTANDKNNELTQQAQTLGAQNDEKARVIAQLEHDINVLNQAAREREESITTLEEQQKQNQTALADAMQKLQEKETECGKIREALESQKRQTEIYKGQVNNDQNVITSLEKRNSEYLQQIETANDKNNELTQHAQTLGAQNVEKDGVIAQLEQDINVLNQAASEREKSIITLEAQQKQNQTALADAMQKLQEKEAECGKIGEALEAQKRQTEVYKGQVNLDQAAMKPLEDKNKELALQLADKDKENQALTHERDQSRSQVQQKDSQINILQQKIDYNNSQIQTLSALEKRVKDENDKRITLLELKLSTAKRDKDALNADVEALKKEKEQLQQAIKELRAKVAELMALLDGKNAEIQKLQQQREQDQKELLESQKDLTEILSTLNRLNGSKQEDLTKQKPTDQIKTIVSQLKRLQEETERNRKKLSDMRKEHDEVVKSLQTRVATLEQLNAGLKPAANRAPAKKPAGA